MEVANPNPQPPPKPRVALAIATGFGLGYIPKAPGTAGSLLGVILAAMLAWHMHPLFHHYESPDGETSAATLHLIAPSMVMLIAAAGVWASGAAARYLQQKDPQVIVIDEVSGQMLAFAPVLDLVNWKYLLLGFILFRVFDIWKPFPARRAERLPGGWGIMADDWVAGVYAALGLWAARAMGM